MHFILALQLNQDGTYRALQLGTASKVAPLDKLSVALTIILAVIFLKEVLDWKTFVGGLLIVLGSIVLVLK